MSRGLRNCNPGNIRRSPGVCYSGEKHPGRDPEFREFCSMEWGFRALFVVLYTYHRRHGLKSCRAWIGRWAPPCENNTRAYVDYLCRRVGITPDQELDPLKEEVMIPLACAICEIENGAKADLAQVQQGWELFLRDYGEKQENKKDESKKTPC